MALTFDTLEAELEHYRSLAKTLEDDLEDTKLALDEFRASAGELEKELEKELAIAEKQLKATQGREEALQSEVVSWKSKYQTALREHTKTMTHMQGELEGLRKSSEEYRKRLRDMELDNDELEGKERMVSSSLQDVESKYGKAIERITLLEEELIEKSKLEEECQRLRDDLREMAEEVGVLRAQAATLRPSSPSETASPSPLPEPEPASATIFEPPSSPSPLSASPTRSRTMSTISPERRSPSRQLNGDLTPRKRLVSTSVASVSPKPSLLPRSISGGSGLFGSSSQHSKIPRPPSSLLADSPMRSASPGTSRIPATSGPAKEDLSASTASRLARSTHLRDLSTVANSNSPAAGSHVATLRAETKRMRGMTHRLVSTRNLREVSAIPVPKGMTSSGSKSALSSGRPNAALGKSVLGRSVSRRAPPAAESAGDAVRAPGPRRSLLSSPAPDNLRASRPPSRISRTSTSSADVSHPPEPPRSPTPTGILRSIITSKSDRPASGTQPNYSRPTSAQAERLRLGQNTASRDEKRKSLGPSGSRGERKFGFGFGFGGAKVPQSSLPRKTDTEGQADEGVGSAR